MAGWQPDSNHASAEATEQYLLQGSPGISRRFAYERSNEASRVKRSHSFNIATKHLVILFRDRQHGSKEEEGRRSSWRLWRFSALLRSSASDLLEVGRKLRDSSKLTSGCVSAGACHVRTNAECLRLSAEESQDRKSRRVGVEGGLRVLFKFPLNGTWMHGICTRCTRWGKDGSSWKAYCEEDRSD